jgi:hypothetical protein
MPFLPFSLLAPCSCLDLRIRLANRELVRAGWREEDQEVGGGYGGPLAVRKAREARLFLHLTPRDLGILG